MTYHLRTGSAAPSSPAHDAGFSLVELIVAGAITVILGAVLASIFIAGATATAQTADRDRASGEVQAISTSLKLDPQCLGRHADLDHPARASPSRRTRAHRRRRRGLEVSCVGDR